MTGRQVLKRSYIRYLAAIGTGMALMFLFMFGSVGIANWTAPATKRPSEAIIISGALVGISLMGVGVFVGCRFLRCPWCYRSFTGLVNELAETKKGAKLICCPFCVKMLDDEAPVNWESLKKGSRKPGSKERAWDDELA